MSIECHQQVVDSIPTAVPLPTIPWPHPSYHPLQVVDSIPTAVPLLVIPRAAHVKELDEPQLVVAAVAKFLHTCEQTRQMAPF